MADQETPLETAKRVAIRKREDLPASMHKYWRVRTSLFSRFEEGILLDQESWFSVTPEAVAYRLAEQCACDVILDACCGAGGNLIQFAMTCRHAVGIEIDPVKAAMARHNATIYGVAHKLTVLCGDFVEFAKSYSLDSGKAEETVNEAPWYGWNHRKIDIIFSSPPWGGVDYRNPPNVASPSTGRDEWRRVENKRHPRRRPPAKLAECAKGETNANASVDTAAAPPDEDQAKTPWGNHVTDELHFPADNEAFSKPPTTKYWDSYSLMRLQPVDGFEMFKLCYNITQKNLFYLPRNLDLEELAQLTKSISGVHISAHVEELWLGTRLKALGVYLTCADNV